ncbi:MAG: hypothetical protein C4527_03415 [Candidatus Omnitrophota bacterium]|nr:MAG: hypothetical protein C4527_03415 [Candidatus Omnitrophota bacterium]
MIRLYSIQDKYKFHRYIETIMDNWLLRKIIRCGADLRSTSVDKIPVPRNFIFIVSRMTK